MIKNESEDAKTGHASLFRTTAKFNPVSRESLKLKKKQLFSTM